MYVQSVIERDKLAQLELSQSGQSGHWSAVKSGCETNDHSLAPITKANTPRSGREQAGLGQGLNLYMGGAALFAH